MATAILFIGWNRPFPGQDQAAFGWLMSEGMPALEKLQGKYFERMEPLALTAHGGDLNGAIVLFGERAKLDELRRTDEFEAWVFKAGSYFDGLGVVPGLNLEGLRAAWARMKK